LPARSQGGGGGAAGRGARRATPPGPGPSAPHPRRPAAAAVPTSGTAPRVYTRDEPSGDAEAPASRQLGKCRVTAGPCQMSRAVCTRGIGFPASARPLGTVLPGIASRVYTRDGVSDPDAAPAPLRQARQPGGMGPMSGTASRVYTRDAVPDGARQPAGGVGRAGGPRERPVPVIAPFHWPAPSPSDHRWSLCPRSARLPRRAVAFGSARGHQSSNIGSELPK
jgi:hypothetical protein